MGEYACANFTARDDDEGFPWAISVRRLVETDGGVKVGYLTVVS